MGPDKPYSKGLRSGQFSISGVLPCGRNTSHILRPQYSQYFSISSIWPRYWECWYWEVNTKVTEQRFSILNTILGASDYHTELYFLIIKPVSSKSYRSQSTILYFAFMFVTSRNHTFVPSGSSHKALWKSYPREYHIWSSGFRWTNRWAQSVPAHGLCETREANWPYIQH